MADDSSATLGAGGIEFVHSATVRMAEEDLSISPKSVDIRFVFANDGDHDIDMLMAFPLPDIDTGRFSEEPLGATTGDPVNFVGFTVKADGKPVAVSVEQRAIYQGRDVTAIVKSVGLPVNVTTQAGFDRLHRLSPAGRKMLIAAGLADFTDSEFPKWTVRTRFYWPQHLPAHHSVVLEQHYQPVTGTALFSKDELDPKNEDGAYYVKNYCLDAAALPTLAKMIDASRKANPEEGGLLNAYTTDYILKTGNNWKGPIGRFRLVLDKLKPGNVLSLCWDGPLAKTGATTFETTRENFAPPSDIRLLVLETLLSPGGL